MELVEAEACIRLLVATPELYICVVSVNSFVCVCSLLRQGIDTTTMLTMSKLLVQIAKVINCL